MKYIIQEKPILGRKLTRDQPVKVIGAGIAGLLSGFYLKKKGFDFEIIEKGSQPGGILGTKRLSNGIAEQAANGFIWCPEFQEVADDLGLKIIGPKATAKKRFIVRNRKLRRFPLSFTESLVMMGKAVLPHSSTLETAADFGHAYFGKAFTQRLLGPGLSGIYGANPQDLSFPGALGSLAKILNKSDLLPFALIKNRSVKAKLSNDQKRRIGTHGFEGGMGALVDALAEHLGKHIRYETDGLAFKDQKEPLLITVPAYQSKEFFSGNLYQLLDRVKYLPLISSTFFFHRKDLARFQDGFGCLIPRTEGLSILGILFNSCIFPNRSKSTDVLSLTCILRDDSADLRLISATDKDIWNKVLGDLDAIFGLNGNPLEHSITRWRNAIPLYSPELYSNWFEMDRLLETDFPNRHLFGNYTGQISVRGMCQAASQITG